MIFIIQKNWENNRIEEIGLVTLTIETSPSHNFMTKATFDSEFIDGPFRCLFIVGHGIAYKT